MTEILHRLDRNPVLAALLALANIVVLGLLALLAGA